MTHSQENNQISSYLKENTVDIGISQRKIQEDLNVSQQYVSALLNGKKPIGKKMAKKLSDLYNLDVAKLLIDDNMYGKETNIITTDNFQNLSIEDKLNKLYDKVVKSEEVLEQKINNLEEKLRLSQLINRTYLRSMITHSKIKTDEIKKAENFEQSIDKSTEPN